MLKESGASLKDKPIKRRVVYIEAVRIAAILMVVWNHSYEKGFWLFLDKAQDSFYYAYIAASVACKAGVPLFFMLSGILLLDKEESIRVVLQKRVLRMVAALVLMGVTMYLYGGYWAMHGDLEKYPVELPLSIGACVHDLYNGLHTEAYWYIYNYLVFLLLLPILRKLVKVMTKGEFFYLAGIYFLCTAVLPAFEFLVFQGSWSYTKFFNFVDIFPWNVFYPLFGYYLAKGMPEKFYTFRYALGILLLYAFCLGISSVLVHERFILLGVVKDEMFHRFLLPVEAMSLYMIFRTMFSRIQAVSKLGRVLRVAGASTFGIYLWERILRYETMWVYGFCRDAGLNELLSGYVWMLFLLSAGVIVVSLLKQLPVLRKIL